MSTRVETLWLGRLSYAESLHCMNEYKQEIFKSKDKVFLLGMEISPCVTLGRRGTREDLIDPLEIKKHKMPVYFTDRGGRATVHSLGQLIIYPLACLSYFHLGVRAWTDKLSQITLDWARELNITLFYNKKDPGFYTEKGKIGFMGLCLKEQISTHGISINVANDLNLFKYIKSCGLTHRPLDKLEHYTEEGLESLFVTWSKYFKKTSL